MTALQARCSEVVVVITRPEEQPQSNPKAIPEPSPKTPRRLFEPQTLPQRMADSSQLMASRPFPPAVSRARQRRVWPQRNCALRRGFARVAAFRRIAPAYELSIAQIAK